MDEDRAIHQDIRALRVAILNFMPTKISTETQILCLLSNSALVSGSVCCTPPPMKPRIPMPITSWRHYVTFDDVKNQKFDGLIITGAPVEQMPFEEVDYWQELQRIMDWSRPMLNPRFTFAGERKRALYHKYGIPKYDLPRKMFGVYEHRLLNRTESLMRGFDDIFLAPHSRHTEIRRMDIEKHTDLQILARSDEAGVYIVSDKAGRNLYITGHSEYDPFTLKAEYDRDVNKGLPIHVPKNYYPNDDPAQEPTVRWRGHANLLYSNWLNYHVSGHAV